MDKRQAFVSLLTKHSRSQKTKNCFCEAYCYYNTTSCTAVLARAPAETVSLEHWLLSLVQSSNTAVTGMKTLLLGSYGESRGLCSSCPWRNADPSHRPSGSMLWHRASTAIFSRGTKHFPNSFYCSGTNLNPGFYQIHLLLFLLFMLTTPPGDSCQINIIGLF